MKIKRIFIALILFLTFSAEAFAYSVIPCGEAVGVIVKTEGVLVSGTSKITDNDGYTVNPAKKAGILKGDRIISANNIPVNTIDELTEFISEATKEIELTVIRSGKEKKLSISPVLTPAGKKTGILVRDSAAGIGTITFVEPESGKFAGLGHGICDLDTNAILPINSGNILKCELTQPTKGKKGLPGELNGEFINSTIGTVSMNSHKGIYGTLNEIPKVKPVEICPVAELTTGQAYILSQVDEYGPKKYSVNIKGINKSDNSGKNLVIEITDSDLISKTGGIVQGMSGSPILQNGKIIGAVTHVFVDDPTTGYGILIENMISEP